jgi:DNA-directed RNA polymerase subunit alpha
LSYAEMMNLAVDELDLSIRATNILGSDGIWTVAELLRRTRSDLLQLRHCDEMRVTEIEECLARLGLKLAE